MNKSKFIFLGIILVIIIAIPFILNYKYEKRIEYAKNINSFNASVSHSSCEDLYYDIGTSIDIICSALLNADIDITQSKKIFTYNEHCLLEKTDSTNVLWNIPKMKTVLKNASICPDEIFSFKDIPLFLLFENEKLVGYRCECEESDLPHLINFTREGNIAYPRDAIIE